MTPGPSGRKEDAMPDGLEILNEFVTWRPDREGDSCPIAPSSPWLKKLAALCDRIAAAEAIVAKLPKSADEVRLLPGDAVFLAGIAYELLIGKPDEDASERYFRERGKPLPDDAEWIVEGYYYESDTGWKEYFIGLVSECYSTEAATCAAIAKAEGGAA